MPEPISSTGQTYPAPLGYKLVQLIGGGGFSKVFRAIAGSPNLKPDTAAVKVISFAPPSISSTRHPVVDRRSLQKEVQIHSVLKHENVLQFLGAVEMGPEGSVKGSSVGDLPKDHRPQGKLASTSVPGLYMVLEFAAGGDLFDKIAPDFGVEEDLAHFYFTQLIAGLEYIHIQGITHRDIKPENLLLDHEGNLKIADFGLCSVYKYKGKERTLNGACGSLPYIAPEMNGTPYRGEPVDVWSSGVVLFALLVGNTPWDEPTSRSPEYAAYCTGELFRYEPWTRLSVETLSLLKKMMNRQPTDRLTIEQIKRDRWFQRKNKLLDERGRCNDPVSLAERLLRGLIVSGDMDLSASVQELHSDGQRAELPGLSSTQPQHLGSSGVDGPTLGWDNFMPSSTAMPALRGSLGSASTQRVPRYVAASQQVMDRRKLDFRGSQQLHGPSSDETLPTGSQFTQAITFYTQGNQTLPPGLSRQANALTRFFAPAAPREVVRRLLVALQSLKSCPQFSIDAIGDEQVVRAANQSSEDGAMDVDVAGLRMSIEESEEDDENAAMITAPRPKSGAAGQSGGLLGSRIRVALADQRKCVLKGEIRIESLTPDLHLQGASALTGRNAGQCLVVMRRSKGSPLEWRRLFRDLTRDENVQPLVSASGW